MQTEVQITYLSFSAEVEAVDPSASSSSCSADVNAKLCGIGAAAACSIGLSKEVIEGLLRAPLYCGAFAKKKKKKKRVRCIGIYRTHPRRQGARDLSKPFGFNYLSQDSQVLTESLDCFHRQKTQKLFTNADGEKGIAVAGCGPGVVGVQCGPGRVSELLLRLCLLLDAHRFCAHGRFGGCPVLS